VINIISHRGYWKDELEKNTIIAFKRSFSLGYGTETDIRDHARNLVISHDMPIGNELKVDDFFDIYKNSNCDELLALNIKSDGLQKQLIKLLDKYEVNNYFLFDMSVPDAVVSLSLGLKSYTRQSEFEKKCSFYETAYGVWMDEFHSDWITNEIIDEHINNDKMVCIVSPELHSRDPMNKWVQYKALVNNEKSNMITICTDLPEQAKEFINGTN